MNAISLRGSRRANLISPDVTMIRMLGHRLRTVATSPSPSIDPGMSVSVNSVSTMLVSRRTSASAALAGFKRSEAGSVQEVHRVAAYPRLVLDNQNVSVFGIAPVVLASKFATQFYEDLAPIT